MHPLGFKTQAPQESSHTLIFCKIPRPRNLFIQSFAQRNVLCAKRHISIAKSSHVCRHEGKPESLSSRDDTCHLPVDNACDVEVIVDQQVVALVVDVFQVEFVVRFGQLGRIFLKEAIYQVGLDWKLGLELTIRDQNQVLFGPGGAVLRRGFERSVWIETYESVACRGGNKRQVARFSNT